MPVPEQRDPDATRAALGAWLVARLPAGAGAAVEAVSIPEFSGFSNETLLVDAVWNGDGGPATRPLVVRVAPTRYRMFPDVRFEEQYRVNRILAEKTALPVPNIRWYEPDPSVLGAPFMVMDRVAGRAPNDSPPYHEAGWVTEVPDEQRARMWWAGVETLAEVHAVDVDALGLGFLGDAGLDEHLAWWRAYQRWSFDGEQPVAEAAYAWLAAHRPAPAGPAVLLWGDARLGNILYVDGVRQAVLDWEMVTLGRREIDLAWFLYLDRHHAEGCNNPRLSGFPDQAATVERYERLTGGEVRDLPYFMVLSGYKFALLMCRAVRLFMDSGLIPPVAADFAVNNSATRLLSTVLAEAGG